jgi:CRP-like cAMP-binding protein
MTVKHSAKIGVKENEDISLLNRRGDLFGEMSLVRKTDRSASVYAVDDTVCLTTDSTYIKRLSGNDKVAFCYILFRGIAGVLADRLNEADEALVKAKEEIKRLKKAQKKVESVEAPGSP